MPHVYILRCGDGSYYVGSTRNLETRLEQHVNGGGGEYTRKRQPVTLVFAEEYAASTKPGSARSRSRDGHAESERL